MKRVIKEFWEQIGDVDDVVFLSELEDELQGLLDVVDGYGRDFRVKFSSEKSKVMVVNRSDDERTPVWRLGEK
ncbi:hypothetical protein E2C01_028025 [Portunus trituberculatus]|uniref:Reverse transcriptase domain-containing protein n=1 Tax=Portunus trituberculatus TaxID=210409 RepID=A0A5B7EN84_PORTR|nr:hypothetical protein [Portunus trituberculatus]